MSSRKTYQAPKTCNLCQGKGTYNPPGIIPIRDVCPGCRGQGSVLVVKPAKKCALCKGRGLYLPKRNIITKAVCTACKGSGWAHAK